MSTYLRPTSLFGEKSLHYKVCQKCNTFPTHTGSLCTNAICTIVLSSCTLEIMSSACLLCLCLFVIIAEERCVVGSIFKAHQYLLYISLALSQCNVCENEYKIGERQTTSQTSKFKQKNVWRAHSRKKPTLHFKNRF